MSEIIRVPLSNVSYDVHVGDGLLSSCGGLIAKRFSPRACAIVTDSNVGPLYGATVEAALTAQGFRCTMITVPAGEKSKCLTQAEKICDAMIAAGLDRGALLVALGGGVIGDLAGFVAAIYFRGIPYVQIPTTVLAQVDSSVGGKTGVNASGGKNLIGSFHQPALVIADTATLESLPRREFDEGFAEIIKHAAIRDSDMLEILEQDDMASLVSRNVAIKAAIVADDERETRGTRALLNFGHTIGHAIENAAGYGKFLHGEAISLGLVAALWLSEKKAGLPHKEAKRVLDALKKFDLPVSLPSEITTPELMQALKTDKKFSAGAIRFVLVPQLGTAILADSITEADLVAAIDALRAT